MPVSYFLVRIPRVFLILCFFASTAVFQERLLKNGTNPFRCSAVFDRVTNLRVEGPKNGLIDRNYRWESFAVYIDPVFDMNETALINEAMYMLSVAVPSLPFGIFIPGSTPSGDYVHITQSDNCSSVVGRQGGAQELSLESPRCMELDIIMHEMIHALGFWHEHSRSDRDDFVTVLEENIDEGMTSSGEEYNFEKYGDEYVTSFGVPYNTRSIMHYGSTGFSRNGEPTIVAKDGSVVGPGGGLQQTDIDKLQKMYSTKKSTMMNNSDNNKTEMNNCAQMLQTKHIFAFTLFWNFLLIVLL